MKKLTIVFITLIMSVFVVNAQELITKKGFTILPEAGDYVIGFDAVPFFDFMLNTVNIMNNTGQTSQHPGFVSGFASVLVGKYYLEDKMAARIKFGINTEKNKEVNYFDDPKDVVANPSDPDLWGEVYDVSTTSNSEIIIGGGLEFRKGHNRLQGFYGGELIFGLATSSAKNVFAVEQNQEAVTNGYWNADGSLVSAPRILSSKDGSELTFGLRGFIGVEYFFAPKISVAGEFGWGLGFSSTGRGFVEIQSWDSVNNVSETKITDGPKKESFFGFGVDDGISKGLAPSAALTLYFHF